MRSRVNGDMADNVFDLASQRIELADAVDLIAEEFHTDGSFSGVGRENLHHITVDTELVADEVDIVALILQFHQLVEQFISVFFHTCTQRDDHVSVVDRVAKRVDTGNGSHDDNISAFRQGGGCGMAQFFDFLVDRAVFFNIGVCIGDISLRLIVIVIGYKVFYRVVGEEFLELTAKLGSESFIVGKDQGRTVDFDDDIGHGKSFTGAGHTHQRLLLVPVDDTLSQSTNGLRLVTGRLVVGNQFKSFRHGITSKSKDIRTCVRYASIITRIF